MTQLEHPLDHARPGANRRRRSDPSGIFPMPFLKWVGGKRQLLPDLLALMPERFEGYHEPFVGGGALFFALQRAGKLDGKRVVLADINHELIDAYVAIRDNVNAVIRHLGDHRYEREHFYEVRGWEPAALSKPARAARMIFLNRAGFNGLYRVNSQGKFNVPFGRYKNPLLCNPDNLRAVSAALRNVALLCEPFERVKDRAHSGDFVYFDPPYVPISQTSNFVSYVSNGFNLFGDQKRLVKVFGMLARRNVNVMLSNSDTPWVREHYAKFTFWQVMARRYVNSQSERRGPVGELIVLGYPAGE